MKNKIKKYIKKIVPPVIFDLRRTRSCNDQYGFAGDYANWQEALIKSGGYDSQRILEKVLDASLKVKHGEAVYERDSVLFDNIQYSWPVLAGLLRIAILNEGHLHVLDFGGSLGSSYFQNRTFLSSLDSLRWSVVEQSNFVKCGRKYFQSEELIFYEDFHSCLSEEKPHVILASGVLQYLEKPFEMIKNFIESGIPWIIIDRTPFLLNDVKNRLTVQKVPPTVYEASYPAWFFNKRKLLQCFDGKYELTAEFDALGGQILIYPDKAVSQDKGLIFMIFHNEYET